MSQTKQTKETKNTVFIKDLSSNVGKEVTIQGWMFNKRSGKGIQFLNFATARE